MDSIQVDDNDLLMVSQLDASLKPDLPLHDVNHHPESSSHHQHPPMEEHPASSDIHNVFEFQQFMDRHEPDAPEPAEGKTAIAALKMIDLHALQVDNQAEDSAHNTEFNGDQGELEALPDSGTGPIVHVEYNPNEKAKRLGRPRKHLNGMPSPAPGESASDNLEKAKISKFRLDERPVEGPGSRGGDPLFQRKNKGKLTESPALRKRKQALLNFTKSEDLASLGLILEKLATSAELQLVGDVVMASAISEVETEPKVEEKLSSVEDENSISKEDANSTGVESNGTQVDHGDSSTVVTEAQEQTAETKTDQKISETEPKTEDAVGEELKVAEETKPEPKRKRTRPVREKKPPAKKPKKAEPKKPAKAKTLAAASKKASMNFTQKASRTTITRERNRVTRTYPGPLLPIHYDLYDDNIIGAEANAATAAEKLALGFPVRKCDYLGDIIFLISYLSKFELIVDFGPVGPEDIEVGLGLNIPDSEEPTRVSPSMDMLFRRLLALVLNRKKPILLSMQKTAIMELRGQYIGLGLPIEWRDDEHIRVVTSLPCDPVKDRVDQTKPEVSSSDNYEYQAPSEKFNPFLENDFDELGLLGISKPIDRLIMLRCLAVWSLSASNQLKTHLTKAINGQDVAGERDTIYGSRAVLKGFNQTTDLKKELELKLAKKNKSLLTPKGTPDPDSITRYIDPSSDPLAHPMALRLNQFLVGDCGFHIGRFYLVRMADASSGGVSSIDKMKSVAKDAAGVRSSIPSSFQLCVEDVHRLLTESLPIFGPEFDEKGREVPAKKHDPPSGYWSVVASNASELDAFIKHVGRRLGLVEAKEDSNDNIISLGSLAHKPLLHMYQYLSLIHPLLQEFEKLEVSAVGEVRTSRKKKVDYTVAREAEWNDEEEYQEEEYAPVEEGDDDDYYEDGDGDGDEYVE